MANSDFKKNYTKRALIDGVLLLANAIQKLNYGRRTQFADVSAADPI